MIQKTISIICEYCFNCIDHYAGYTVAEAIITAKRKGIIFKFNRHFCNDDCLRGYKIKIKGGVTGKSRGGEGLETHIGGPGGKCAPSPRLRRSHHKEEGRNERTPERR